MNRRTFLQSSAAATLAGNLFSFAGEEKKKLNILLINVEDMGTHLGCYGDRQIATPNIDGFAKQSILFQNAYITQASCSPSRSSILTGLYPHQNGQLGLAHYGYCRPAGLPNMPGELKKAGYYTGVMGKLHTAPESDFPFDFHGIKHGETRKVKKVGESFRDFLGKSAEKPFFFYLNLCDAHAPFLTQVDGNPKTPLKPEEVKVWPWLGTDTPETRKRIANYYNCVARIDLAVGEALKALANTGHEDDTLVVFMSDHGASFCRAKTSCYEAGVRVPMIVRKPGNTKNGSCTSLVSSVDLMPTFLDLAGVPLPEYRAGESLLPLLAGNSENWRKYLFTEYTTHGPTGYFPRRTVRDQRYKLIVNYLGEQRKNPTTRVDGCPAANLSQTDKCKSQAVKDMYKSWFNTPKYELFDLSNDPAERHNLAKKPEMKTVLDRLLAALADWQRETEDPIATEAGLAKLTKYHDDNVTTIKTRIKALKEKAKKTGKKTTRREFNRARQIKATYDRPAEKHLKK